MAGTSEGGCKTAVTNKTKYGADYYARIGSKGGQKTRDSGKLAQIGFANDDRTLLEKMLGRPKRATLAGRKGGKISRRGSIVKQVEDPTIEMKAVVSVIPPHNTFYVEVRRKDG